VFLRKVLKHLGWRVYIAPQADIWRGNMPAQTQAKEAELQEVDVKKLRSMKVTDAMDFTFSVPPEIGVVILGPPGIGKTENAIRYAIMEAQKKGLKPIILNEARATMTMDEYMDLIKNILMDYKKYYLIAVVPFGATMPDDLIGVPNIISIKDDSGKVLAVFEESALKGSLALLTYKDIHGVLIIDDALNAHDNVRRSFLTAVFQERLVGGFNGVKLSPNVRVIATGNLSSESDLAVRLPKTMVGRASMIYARPDELKSWYQVMQSTYGDKWYKEVYAFLSGHDKYYNAPHLIEEEIPVGPVPRAWTKLAVALYHYRDKFEELLKTPEGREIAVGIVASFVGTEAAMQFVAFVSKPIATVEEVIRNPAKLDEMAKDMDLALRFGVHLADRIEEAAKKNDKDKLIQYLEVLVNLMEKTTNDVGAFVYDMLSKDAKSTVRRIVASSITSGDPKVRNIAAKIRSTLVSLAIADVLAGAS